MQALTVPCHNAQPRNAQAPDINSGDYLERIRTYGGCSACCFVLGLQYVERLQQIDPAYKLNSFNMHRLVVTGIMVAAKFVDDFYFSNNYWSKVNTPPRKPKAAGRRPKRWSLQPRAWNRLANTWCVLQ